MTKNCNEFVTSAFSSWFNCDYHNVQAVSSSPVTTIASASFVFIEMCMSAIFSCQCRPKDRVDVILWDDYWILYCGVFFVTQSCSLSYPIVCEWVLAAPFGKWKALKLHAKKNQQMVKKFLIYSTTFIFDITLK